MSVLAERDVFNWIVGIQPIGKVSILNVGSYGLDAPPPSCNSCYSYPITIFVEPSHRAIAEASAAAINDNLIMSYVFFLVCVCVW